MIPASYVHQFALQPLEVGALEMLGLPESPTVYQAICNVARLLTYLDEKSTLDARTTFNARFHTASGVALFSQPLEWAIYDFLRSIDADADAERLASEAHVARRTKRTDWLGPARDEIKARGLDPGPDGHSLATYYGWRPYP